MKACDNCKIPETISIAEQYDYCAFDKRGKECPKWQPIEPVQESDLQAIDRIAIESKLIPQDKSCNCDKYFVKQHGMHENGCKLVSEPVKVITCNEDCPIAKDTYWHKECVECESGSKGKPVAMPEPDFEKELEAEAIRLFDKYEMKYNDTNTEEEQGTDCIYYDEFILAIKEFATWKHS